MTGRDANSWLWANSTMKSKTPQRTTTSDLIAISHWQTIFAALLFCAPQTWLIRDRSLTEQSDASHPHLIYKGIFVLIWEYARASWSLNSDLSVRNLKFYAPGFWMWCDFNRSLQSGDELLDQSEANISPVTFFLGHRLIFSLGDWAVTIRWIELVCLTVLVIMNKKRKKDYRVCFAKD